MEAAAERTALGSLTNDEVRAVSKKLSSKTFLTPFKKTLQTAKQQCRF